MTRRVVSILALCLTGCAAAKTLRRDLVEAEYVVPRDGARSATVSLQAHGQLAVRGGSCSLVQARARYDAARAEASADFEIDEDGHGTVTIALAQTGAPVAHTEMDVCISTELPLRLASTAGKGDVAFELSGVQLRDFDSTTGIGDVTVDFGDASIASASMSLQSGTGDITIDAKRGSWTGENSLQIDAGTGDVTIYLPRAIGLRVEVDRGTGDLAVRGLERDGDHYVNTLSSSAEDRLNLQIDAGIGDITIIAG